MLPSPSKRGRDDVDAHVPSIPRNVCDCHAGGLKRLLYLGLHAVHELTGYLAGQRVSGLWLATPRAGHLRCLLAWV